MNDVINTKDIISKINEIQKENEKLNDFKNRYIEHAKELMDVSIEMQALQLRITNIAKKIDPILTISPKRERVGRGQLRAIINEVFEKMKAGDHITMNKLSLIYPDLKEEQLSYVMQSLQKISSVQKAKDGRSVRLYL